MQRIVVVSLAFVFLLESIAAAWINDDAFITFRVVDNLLAGYGPRYNPAERVQAFTHPLWMGVLAVAHSIGGEPYYSTIFLSLGLALAALLILGLVLAPTWRSALVSMALACASSSLVEYSTSGLENPLSHLLLAAFAASLYRERSLARRPLVLGVLASLALLNRLDHALLVIPGLALAVVEQASQRTRATIRLSLAFLPLVAWEAFSIVYYGFPFPNTAYAKLGTGLEPTELARQGIWYLENGVVQDPPVALALTLAAVSAAWSRDRRSLALMGGIVLHLAYLVRVGGDFMSGRFLTGPFVVALAICSQAPFRPASALAAAIAGFLLANPAIPYLPGGTGTPYRSGGLDDHGICDERAIYYPFTGLIRPTRAGVDPVDHPWRSQGLAARQAEREVVVRQTAGMFGYYCGPGVHVVDSFALGDPLLARLPAVRGAWRIGHFARAIPPGYPESLESGVNRIADPPLAEFYDHLRTVVRDPLWSRQRFVEIWRLNTGRYDSLVDRERWSHPQPVTPHD